MYYLVIIFMICGFKNFITKAHKGPDNYRDHSGYTKYMKYKS